MENPQVTMGFTVIQSHGHSWLGWFGGTPMTWETIGNLHVKLVEHVPPWRIAMRSSKHRQICTRWGLGVKPHPKHREKSKNDTIIYIHIYGLCNSPFLGCVTPMFDCWSPNAWLVDIVLWNSQEEPEEPPPTAMLRLDWKAGELPGCHQWDIYSEHVPPKCIQMYHGHFSVTRFGSFFIHLHFVCME